MHEDQPTVVLDAVGRRSRKGRRVLIGLLVTVLALVLATAAAVYVLTESLGNNVSRVPDAFAGIPADARPAATAGMTFLLIGTDTRSPDPTTGTDAPTGVNAGSQRSDVIMLARVAAGGRTAA